METGADLERLVVRLVGEGSDYERVLDEAVAATEQAAQRIGALTESEMAEQNAAMEEAARITATVATPLEQYAAKLERLEQLYVAGYLGQEAYNRSVKAATAGLPSVQAAQEAYNKVLGHAAEVTRATRTPVEVFTTQIQELKQHLATGRITQETYNRAVAAAAKSLPAVSAAAARYAEQLRAGKELTVAASSVTTRYRQRLAELSAIYRAGAMDANVYRHAVNMAKKDFTKGAYAVQAYATAVSSAGRSMRNFGMMASLGVTMPLAGVGTMMMKTAAEAETTRAQFDTMLGAKVGGKLLGDLRQFAMATPFRFGELSAGSKALLGFGTEVENVLPYMKMLGDVSAGTGKGVSELAVVFGQIRGLGRLQGQDFLQLVNAGFPVVEIAKTMKMSMKELQKAMGDGEVPFAAVEETFRRVTSEGGRFYGMTEKLSKTAAGTYSTLQDEIGELARVFGEELLPYAKEFIAWLTDTVKRFQDMSAETKQSILAWGGFAMVFPVIMFTLGSVVTVIGGVVGALAMLNTWLTTTTVTVNGLHLSIKAMLLTTLKWVAVVGLVVAAVWLIAEALLGTEGGFLDFVNSIRIGGISIGAHMQLATLNVMLAWDWCITQVKLLWESLKLVAADVGGAIYRGVLRIAQGISDAFWWVVSKATSAMQSLANKTIDALNTIGVLGDETAEKARTALAKVQEDMKARGKSASNYYTTAINNSLAEAENRWGEYQKKVDGITQKHDKEADILRQTKDQILSEDKKANKADKAKEVLLDRLGLGAAGAAGAGGGVGGGGGGGGGVPRKDFNQVDFQQVSLNRLSLAGLTGYGAPKAGEQNVKAGGVESRLDQLIDITRSNAGAGLLAE